MYFIISDHIADSRSHSHNLQCGSNAPVYSRHKLLTRFLMLLGVSEGAASADACKMEHDLSDESFERIMAYVERLKP